MSYKCEICGEEFFYEDEVALLDCCGQETSYSEYGEIYGCVCNICYDEHYEMIINNVSKFGYVNP